MYNNICHCGHEEKIHNQLGECLVLCCPCLYYDASDTKELTSSYLDRQIAECEKIVDKVLDKSSNQGQN